MNLRLRINKMSEWTGARLVSSDPCVQISEISTDSRTIRRGQFFIPIRGENFDGHDFISDAVKKGAGGFVYSSIMKSRLAEWEKNISTGEKEKYPILETSDTLRFLEDLARNYLGQYELKVIGITGSAGKTTTKNFLTGILGTRYRVQSTPENYNTEIGVSKAILDLKEGTDFFIAELGMRGKGQIGFLADLCGVSIGAITVVGNCHLEFFKDIEEIALAKAEIAESIERAGGILFLNADDDMTPFIKRRISCRIAEFGRDRKCQLNFIETGSDDRGRFSFDLFTEDKKISSVKLGIPGFHNIYNACCAAAIGQYLGIEGSHIKEGLENALLEGSRMELLEYRDIIVLNDCYNANPLSVRKAIDTLEAVPGSKNGRKVAILGDMLELGPKSGELHFKTGEYLSEKNIDVLIALGKLSKNIYEGFISGSAGRTGCYGFYFKTREELFKELGSIIKAGDTVLVKGSRANRMEDIIEKIIKK